MKILMQNRPNAYTMIGGDTFQMDYTAKYLGKLGVKVDISLDFKPVVKSYDLIHIFNIQRPEESLLQLENAKKANKKVIVSTIFWDTSNVMFDVWRNRWVREKKFQNLKMFFNFFPNLTEAIYNKKFKKENLARFNSQREILQKADLLLPNSQLEIDQLAQYFSLPKIAKKCLIIPNAVDKKILEYKVTGELVKKYKLNGFVLEVGRIERNKNQLRLIKALKGKNIQLVLAGEIVDKEYFKICQKEADDTVHFLGLIEHERLPELYTFAKVHVLPSFRETPGLASLEAGLFGCNLASTNIGSAKEYFGNDAFYCDPNKIKSIEKAVIDAYKAPLSPKLKKRILKNYNWDIAAKKTLKAYQQI